MGHRRQRTTNHGSRKYQSTEHRKTQGSNDEYRSARDTIHPGHGP